MTSDGRISALKNRWVVLLIYFVLTAVAGLGLGAGAAALDLPPEEAVWPFAFVMLLAMAGALWACVYWWRRTDEAAKEAHKWSFFWGATVGIAVLGVFVPHLTFTDAGVEAARGAGFGDERDLILFGLLLAVFAQMVGYGVAWAAWWLKRR